MIERIKKLSLNEKVFSGKEYAALVENSMDKEDPENPRINPSDIPGICKININRLSINKFNNNYKNK